MPKCNLSLISTIILKSRLNPKTTLRTAKMSSQQWYQTKICPHSYIKTGAHTHTFLPVSESSIKWLPPHLCGRLGRLTFGHLSIISFNSQAAGKMESGGQQLSVLPWQQLHWSSYACWDCSSKCAYVRARERVCVRECPFLFLVGVCVLVCSIVPHQPEANTPPILALPPLTLQPRMQL